MKILALEFSANERSVALAACDERGAITLLASVKEQSREMTGLALIDRALQQAGVSPGEVTDIIVGLGPGSYTGIRSAIALAQGWQLGREVRVTGIGSIDCLGAQAQAQGMRGRISIIVDAQRSDVYLQNFQLNEGSAEPLDELRIVPRENVRELTKVVGPDAKKFLANAIEMAPSAEFLVKLRKAGAVVPGEKLEPIYLRETSFVKAPTPRQIG